MPKATVTHNNGVSPIIPANGSRTALMVQNNTTISVRYRLFGEVSLSQDANKGLLLGAAVLDGKPGGMVLLTGALAQRPLYALHEGTAEDVVKLDWEGDA